MSDSGADYECFSLSGLLSFLSLKSTVQDMHISVEERERGRRRKRKGTSITNMASNLISF